MRRRLSSSIPGRRTYVNPTLFYCFWVILIVGVALFNILLHIAFPAQDVSTFHVKHVQQNLSTLQAKVNHVQQNLSTLQVKHVQRDVRPSNGTLPKVPKSGPITVAVQIETLATSRSVPAAVVKSAPEPLFGVEWKFRLPESPDMHLFQLPVAGAIAAGEQYIAEHRCFIQQCKYKIFESHEDEKIENLHFPFLPHPALFSSSASLLPSLLAPSRPPITLPHHSE